jgi:hypothetical protein
MLFDLDKHAHPQYVEHSVSEMTSTKSQLSSRKKILSRSLRGKLLLRFFSGGGGGGGVKKKKLFFKKNK